MGSQNGEQFYALLPVILVILGVGIVAIVGWLIWVFARPGRPAPIRSGSQGGVCALNFSGGFFRTHTSSFSGAGPRYRWVEIYVRGQRYRTLDAISDASTREEVISAILSPGAFCPRLCSKAAWRGPRDRGRW